MTVSTEERVLDVLIKLGGAATSHEIAEALGWEGRGGVLAAATKLRGLIERGRVERVGHRAGLYRVKRLVQPLKRAI